MSESQLEGVTVRPLFYDAISGEFTPPSDSDRQHTLGRLTFAALAKGEEIEDGRWGSPFVSYRPSWAPDVTATVCYNMYEDELKLVNGLWLRTDTGNHTLHVGDNRLRSRRTGVYLSNGANTREFPLSLGTELTKAKDAVTTAAQYFFDSV